MSRARYYDIAQFPDPLTGILHKSDQITVTVYNDGTTTPASDILYQADSGGGTLPNPFTTVAGSQGIVEFYVDTEKRFNVKYDGLLSGYGIVTKSHEAAWPDPGLLRTSLRSIDGTYVMQYSTSGGILTAPGLLAKYGGWNLEVDGGLTPDSVSAATTNATKFQTLVTKLGTLGGGDIHVNDNFYINNITLHHGAGATKPINLIGRAGFGSLTQVGTAGPFIDTGISSTHRMDHAIIADLIIFHNDPVESGPTIRIGDWNFDYKFYNVQDKNSGVLAPSTKDRAAFSSLEAKYGFSMQDCKWEMRTDAANLASLTQVGLLFSNNTWDIGGPFISNTDFSGCMDRSIGIRFAGNHVVDTPSFTMCLIKDHERGIVANTNVAPVANLQANGVVIDGITGTGIFLEPPNGGDCVTWQFSNLWCKSLDHNVFLSGSNSGGIASIFFYGGYMTDALLTAFYAQGGAGIHNLQLHGVNILSNVNTVGEYGIVLGDVAGAIKSCKVIGCTVQVNGSSSGAARFSTGAQYFTVDQNHWVGVNAIQGFSTAGGNGSYTNNLFMTSLA